MIWRPIETAPKDGTRILAYGKGPYGHVEWFTSQWDKSQSCWVSEPNEATEYNYEDCHPTHWMPLPPPPELG